jgi:hypothetical protein
MENKYILRNMNEYFPFTRISEPVHVPLTKVQSFLGPKFFLPMDYYRSFVKLQTSGKTKVQTFFCLSIGRG